MNTRITRAALALMVMAAGCATHRQPAMVPVANTSVFVDDGPGGGLPLVFIHGNGGSTRHWSAQLDHFRSSGRRAVAIDLPGFGKSPMPAGADMSLGAMAAAIDQATHAIGVDRFVMVGHSYGGAVAAKHAALHPEKVAGVVYVDAAAVRLPVTTEQMAQIVAAIRADKGTIVQAMFTPLLKSSSDSVRKEVLASGTQTSADAFAGALTSLTDYDAKALVNAYKGPRLAIVATDLETPMSFQVQFPEVEVVRVPGVGHWIMLDKPAAVNAAIDAFLTKVR